MPANFEHVIFFKKKTLGFVHKKTLDFTLYIEKLHDKVFTVKP